MTDLGGVWRAAVADEELRRTFASDDFDDDGWESIPVPGHWRSVPAFAESDGPLLYRTRFAADRPVAGERAWLVLDGIFYQSAVWLDGAYLGETEGYFFPHAFEITELAADRTDHVLAVEVTCAPQRDRTRKRNLTGIFQHWDCIDPEWNPGGVWRPVRLEASGPVRLRDVVVACEEATADHAVVRLGATLDARAAVTIELATRVGRADHLVVQPLAAGENRVAWTVVVSDPPLWWPRALGDPTLVDATVDVRVANGDDPGDPGDARDPHDPHNPRDPRVSDRRAFRTGLRKVELTDWICRINGERLFLKGTNYGPTRTAIGEATPEEIARDVALVADTGLDLLRVHGHVARPELYDATDDAGLLVWQDMPLQFGYARGVRAQAVRQAVEAVKLLGHHPSVAFWCGHNEPMALDIESGTRPGAKIARQLAAQALPTWNKSILDRSIKRALEEADGTRPVIAHSGVLPHPLVPEGTDSHLYFGWYWGDAADLPRVLARWPRLAYFVSEFGAQAVPEEAAFCEPDRWPELDWGRLARRHNLQPQVFDRTVPPDAFETFAGWKAATQRYQEELIKLHVETLRRLKYRPTGGFTQFLFADAHPAITWSVLGHDREPKAGYHALAAACRPVVVLADWPPVAVHPGDTLALDIHVVSDLRHPIDDATVVARLRWDGGDHVWQWRGDVPADSCVRVGTIQAVVPEVTGDVRLELLLHGPTRATNVYCSQVVR